MRIYLPATIGDLSGLVNSGEIGFGLTTAFAVTPGLRAWYRDEDDDELEYAAMLEAARASLRLIDADTDAVPRRVVIAADVADADVTVHDDLDRGVVRIAVPVNLKEVASVHVDSSDAEPAVRAAATAMVQAELGEEEAQDLVDDAEGYELAWYANQEIAALIELM